MACVYVYVIALTFFGPEALGRDFSVELDEDMAAVVPRHQNDASHEAVQRSQGSSDDGSGFEKGTLSERERHEV